MTVEKISIAKSSNITPRASFKGEENNTPVQSNQSTGSSKSAVTALSVLAAIGAAGVAVYKHKSMKDAVKKAEVEAKKKVEEAEEKAKKAAEDVEKKIAEAVEKVKNEYEKSAKKTEKITESAPKKTDNKGIKTKTTIKLKAGENKPASKKLEKDIPDTSLKKIDQEFVNEMKKNENGLIVVPRSTKLSEILGKKSKALKNSFVKLKNKFKQTLIKKLDDIITESEVTENKTEKSFNFDGVKEFFSKKYQGLKNIFRKKTVQDKPYKKFFDEGAAKGVEYLDKAAFDKRVKAAASDFDNNIWLKLKHQIKEKEYEELFKDVLDVRKIAEKDLISEYNELKNAVKRLPVDSPKAQRFLEIQGELLNHRGYTIKDGELHRIQPYEKFFGRRAEKGLDALVMQEMQEAFIKNTADIRNSNWVDKQKKIKEVEYQRLFEKYFEEKENAARKLSNEKFFGEGAAEGLSEIEKQTAEGLSLKQASDSNNANWLAEQKKIKEQEYQKLFDEYFAAKEAEANRLYRESFFGEGAQKGIREIDLQEKTDSYSKLVSNAKNANWLAEQKKIKEQEYQKLFDEYFAAKEAEANRLYREGFFDETANKGLLEIEKQSEENISSKQISDVKNSDWLAEQKKIKEQEYQKLFDEYFAAKEAEANRLYREGFFDEGAEEGLREVEKQTAEGLSKKQASDSKNANWLAEQKKVKEQEYQKLFDEYFEEKNAKAKSIVSTFESKLDGKGNLIPEFPRKHNKQYHKKLQKEYDKLAILPEKPVQIAPEEQQKSIVEIWKDNVRPITKEYEQKLNGNISVSVSEPISEAEHNKIQKEYDKMHQQSVQEFMDRASNLSGISVKKEGGQENRIKVAHGLNELPERFNDEQRNLVKYLWRRTRLRKDDVTKYPKLYSTVKEEKAAKKAYQKAKQAHIERRVKEYYRHTGMNHTETAVENSYALLPSDKYSYKKYESMLRERPEPQDWDVEMTREEFMKNRDKYITENFARERQTQGIGQFLPHHEKHESRISKIKKFFGF